MALTIDKKCKECGKTQPIENFHKQGKYRKARCRTCMVGVGAGGYAALSEDQKVRYAKTAKMKRYGITSEEYDDLFASPACAICNASEPTSRGWAIDHNHETGKVRGLLCQPCNMALGLFRDNVANLERAIAYLEVNDGPNN